MYEGFLFSSSRSVLELGLELLYEFRLLSGVTLMCCEINLMDGQDFSHTHLDLWLCPLLPVSSPLSLLVLSLYLKFIFCTNYSICTDHTRITVDVPPGRVKQGLHAGVGIVPVISRHFARL